MQFAIRSLPVVFCTASFVHARQRPSAQPAKGIKLEVRGCKLRNGVNWQGALKQKCIKQMGVCMNEDGCRTHVELHVKCLLFLCEIQRYVSVL
jgi:hypothetical protein